MKAHWVKVTPGQQFRRKSDDAVVKVMAIAGRYAMVRRPGAMPFVLSTKELRHQKEWAIHWHPQQTPAIDAERKEGV